MARSWPRPIYEVRAEFRAPLEFVFRWCTDFTAEDSKYEAETYRRRIVQRSKRTVVYEDLVDSKQGWLWARHVVHLMPPNRWHSDSVGSHRDLRLDYRLSPLPGNRTELVLTARRRPAGLGRKNPAKAKWEREVSESWVKLGKSLEREYRKARKP